MPYKREDPVKSQPNGVFNHTAQLVATSPDYGSA